MHRETLNTSSSRLRRHGWQLIAVLLAFALVAAACGDDATTGSEDADTTTAEEPAADEPAADEPVADEPAADEPAAEGKKKKKMAKGGDG